MTKAKMKKIEKSIAVKEEALIRAHKRYQEVIGDCFAANSTILQIQLLESNIRELKRQLEEC